MFINLMKCKCFYLVMVLVFIMGCNEQVRSLVDLNIKYYGSPVLSISLGVSTSEKGSDLEQIMLAANDNVRG